MMHNTTTMPFQYRTSRGGFTLIEAAAVIVIIAIFAMLVIPSVSQISTTRCIRATQLLSADIAYAQSNSIGNAADPCVIVIHPVGDQYHLARRSAPDKPIRNPADGMPYTTTFGLDRASALTGITISSATAPLNLIEFTGLGALAQPENITIQIRDIDAMTSLEIDATSGRARTLNP